MADESYFTAAALRDYAGGLAGFTDAQLDVRRLAVEATIERLCGTSFVVRTHTETLPVDSGEELTLTRHYVRTVTALNVAGIPVASAELSDRTRYQLLPLRSVLRRVDGRRWDSSAIADVTYLAGALAAPPADLQEAAMEATRIRLYENKTAGVPSRATSITNEFGNVSLSTASVQRPFGIPDVDAVVLGYREAWRIPVTA